MESHLLPLVFGRYLRLGRWPLTPHSELCPAVLTGLAGFEREVTLHIQAAGRPQKEQDAFLSAAQRVSTLGASLLPSVLDITQVEGHATVVLEPLRGPSLGDLIRALDAQSDTPRSPIAVPICLGVVNALLCGLNACDQHGAPAPLAHGGLSPAAIRLERGGGVKVVGMGLAVGRGERGKNVPLRDRLNLLEMMDSLLGEAPIWGRDDLGTALMEHLSPELGLPLDALSVWLTDVVNDIGGGALEHICAALQSGGMAGSRYTPPLTTQALTEGLSLTLSGSNAPLPKTHRNDLAPGQCIDARYQILNSLGQGGMGAVYRALDRLTGKVLVLKRMLHAEGQTDDDSQGSRRRFVQEFRTLTSLRHPGIVSVLDFGFDEDGEPYFTMELHEGAQSAIEASGRLPHQLRFDLLAQLLRALAFLHHKGVLHCDIKPQNVLVVGRQVKVVDFGVSIARERDPTGDPSIGGTLAYAAPEVLRGNRPTVASDLFSLGVLATQLLVERHPFVTDGPQTLLYNLFNTEPDLSSEDISDEVRALLKELLSLDVAHRPASAHETLTRLAAATGLPLKLETTESRDSVLHGARLVGREDPLDQLTTALEATMAGRGQVVLIGGESGVGKTRMLQELRAAAEVAGAIVVTGQAVSEASAPYRVWHTPLRMLLLHHAPDAHQLAVLATMTPGVDSLLGVKLPPLPAVDGADGRARQINAAHHLIRGLHRPAVVLLEDLQWAGGESVTLLDNIAHQLGDRPILIVGTFRNDEAPDLPERVPGATTLALKSLGAGDITELAAHILGRSDLDRRLCDLLITQTEGNPFFVIEVVRALAEDAGSLQEIADLKVPTGGITTGGLQRYLRRRLNLVSEDDRELLRLAAVCGRTLDLELIARCQPEVDIEPWLRRCAQARILEVEEGDWRFAHDKLREFLTIYLGTAHGAALNFQIAQGLEALAAVRGDDPRVAAATIAQHFLGASRYDLAAPWALRAGERASQTNAYGEAIRWLERALDSKRHLGLSPPEEARVLRLLGEALVHAGRDKEGQERFAQGLTLLGHPLPERPLSWVISLTSALAVQSRHLLRPPATTEATPATVEASQLYFQQLLQAYVGNDVPMILLVTLANLNLCGGMDGGSDLALALAGASLTASAIPLHSLADRYRERALVICERLDDEPTRTAVYELTSMHLMGVGRLEEAIDYLSRGLLLALDGGAGRRQAEITGCLLICYGQLGRWDKMLEVGQQEYEIGERYGDPMAMMWALCGRMERLIWSQNETLLAQAAAFSEQMSTLLPSAPRIERYRHHAATARCALATGDAHKARIHALASLAAIDEKSAPGAVYGAEAYVNLASALVTLVAQGDASLTGPARRAIGKMKGCAKIFPLIAPGARMVEGDWLLHQGKKKRAIRRYHTALALAQQMKQRAMEAQLLVRLADMDAPSTAALLTQARAAFTAVEGPAERHVRALISPSEPQPPLTPASPTPQARMHG